MMILVAAVMVVVVVAAVVVVAVVVGGGGGGVGGGVVVGQHSYTPRCCRPKMLCTVWKVWCLASVHNHECLSSGTLW